MPVWNDKMAGHQAARGQVSVDSVFTWSLLHCSAYQFCSSNVWVLQHHSIHAFDMGTIIVFVYLWLQFKWNQLSSNSCRHTSCIHKGLNAAKWPDLLTSKTICFQYTGIPLDILHWNHTGWFYHPVVFQWQSSAHLHNWNTLEDHWKTTRRPLEVHWQPTIPSPVAFQCTLGSKFQSHWIATVLPLHYHIYEAGSNHHMKLNFKDLYTSAKA